MRAVLGLVVLALLASGCGGAGRGLAGSATPAAPVTPTAPTCPLEAADVSAIVGETMTRTSEPTTPRGGCDFVGSNRYAELDVNGVGRRPASDVLSSYERGCKIVAQSSLGPDGFSAQCPGGTAQTSVVVVVDLPAARHLSMRLVRVSELPDDEHAYRCLKLGILARSHLV